MTFLPVVQRELRVAARRRGAFWSRLVAATIAVTVGAGTLWLEADWRSSATLGQNLFLTLSNLAFLFCLAAGPLLTADVLSEERREGTLGLLFLTDLRGYDVVGGKLVAASVTALFSLLATLPVLAIPILLGGVPLGEFGRVALVLGNTLLFSLSAGMLVSACSDQARSAFALAVLVLFLAAGFVPWLGMVLAGQGALGWWTPLLRCNPSSAMELSRAAALGKSLAPFWGAIAGTHGLAWLFLAGAGWITQRAWREQSTAHRTVRWRTRWLAWNYGDGEQRRRMRSRLLDLNPIFWLGSRNQLKVHLLWGSVGLALGCWILWRWGSGASADNWGSTFFVTLLIQAPLKWLMASEASQRWANERATGALELILTTPLGVPAILRGHWQSLRRLFGGPAIAIVLVAGTLVAASGTAGPNQREMAAMTVVGAVVFLWDLHALGWVGLWLGLAERKPNRAFIGAGFRILVVPWLAFLVTVFFTGVNGWSAVPLLWLAVCAACNWAFQLWARHNLQELLREIATQRFDAPVRGSD